MHSHDHGHSHTHGASEALNACKDFHAPEQRERERKVLSWLIGINLFGMVVEIVGGLMTNSLALLSDAGHMFTHLFSLLVAYIALVMAGRSRNDTMTFGYYRMEILAAFFNGLTIFAIVLLIVVEAFWKIMHSETVLVNEMVGVAIFGLIVNLVGAWMLTGLSKKDINLRAVLVHLLSDTFSSVAILAGGAVIHYTGWYFVDPLASVLIAAVIGYWGWGLLKTSSKVLLQAVPEGVDPDQVIQAMQQVEGVKRVYDVHIWELTSQRYVMTGHVITSMASLAETQRMTEEINRTIRERFGIGHTTFQFETAP